MNITNIQITVIEAEEGKVLRHIKSGVIYGKKVTLGYNYYELGIGLSVPVLLTPDDFEEIDEPEGWEEKPIIDQVKVLKRTAEIVAEKKAGVNDLNLTAKEALQVTEWFPIWGEGIKTGDTLPAGTRFQYDGKLWEVRQDHQVLSHYYPSTDTASLYMEVVDDSDVTLGTIDNPIEYDGNMALENGKYYTQNGLVYLCTRDSGNPVYHALADLVGYYVVVA